MNQVSLFDIPASIEDSFRRFHRDNPQVYASLVSLCRRWRERGQDKWSIDGAFEVLRWTLREQLPTDAREPWRLNNNYRSRFARLIMSTEPDLADIFETRELKS